MSRQDGGQMGSIVLRRGRLRTSHPGFSNLTTSHTDIERIVQELMDGELSKAQRIQRLRDLAASGDDVPQDLMDPALRKLMERITE